MFLIHCTVLLDIFVYCFVYYLLLLLLLLLLLFRALFCHISVGQVARSTLAFE